MSTPEYRRSRFDSDCYIVEWSEAEHSEQLSEMSEMSYGSDLGAETASETASEAASETETEVGSDFESGSTSDGFLDVTSSTIAETSDEDEPKIPKRII